MKNSTTVAQRIAALHGQIDTALSACLTTNKRAEALHSLSSVLPVVETEIANLAQNHKGKFVKTRKSLMVLRNIMDGCCVGLSDRSINRQELCEIANTVLGKQLPVAQSSLAADSEAQPEAGAMPAAPSGTSTRLSDKQKKLRVSLSSSPDLKSALQVVRDALASKPAAPVATAPVAADPSAEELAKLKASQLAKLKASREALPVRVTSDFSLVRMPIVPIFSNDTMNNPETFKKLGIRHFLVAGYAILLDQLVIAVSNKAASSEGLSTFEYAQAAVSLLNARGNEEYDFVSDWGMPNPRNRDVTLFWIITRARMRIMTRIALSGRNASTVKWGFPFQ